MSRPTQTKQSPTLTSPQGVWWRLGLLVLAGCVAYSNSLSGPFAFDDQLSIVNSPEIRNLSNLERVLSPEKESPVAGRPLVNLSFAINYAIGGLEVGGYHVWNIALHLICGLLLFGMVRRTLSLAGSTEQDPAYVAKSQTPNPKSQIKTQPSSRFGIWSLGFGIWDFRRSSVDLAFATALIWTLHPLNTEAVNYLTQRTELMMALFYALTLYAAIRAIGSRPGPTTGPTRGSRAWDRADPTRGSRAWDRARQPRWGGCRAYAWEALAVVSCGLGMACKESMVTAPLMVALYDRVFAFESLKDSLRARWRLYGGLSLTWLLLAYLMLPGPRSNSVGFSTGIHPWTYLLNQTVMITQYLRLSVWPTKLVANYGFPLPLTLADVLPQALLITCLFVLTVIALIRWPGSRSGAGRTGPRERSDPSGGWGPAGKRRLGFLGAWFFITLAPTSSIVPIATEVGAERRMYLPLMALIALAVVGGARLWESLRRRASDADGRSDPLSPGDKDRLQRAGRTGPTYWLTHSPFTVAAVLIVISGALAAGTITRNREYQSALSLAQTSLERWPTAVASQMVGTELSNLGRDEEAITYLSESAKTHSRARYHLGIALSKTGKLDEAVEQFQMFAREEPLLLEVVSARVFIGQAHLVRRRWTDAANEFRLVLSMSPSHVQAKRLLADAVFSQEKYDEASGLYREYLRRRPNDEGALANLGIALVATEKLDEAIAVFRRAIEANPQSSDAHRNLAEALLDDRDPAGAAVEAQQVVKLSPNTPDGYDVLGRALALQGQIDAAIAQFERALQIDPDHAAARDHLTRLLKATGR